MIRWQIPAMAFAVIGGVLSITSLSPSIQKLITWLLRRLGNERLVFVQLGIVAIGTVIARYVAVPRLLAPYASTGGFARLGLCAAGLLCTWLYALSLRWYVRPPHQRAWGAPAVARRSILALAIVFSSVQLLLWLSLHLSGLHLAALMIVAAGVTAFGGLALTLTWLAIGKLLEGQRSSIEAASVVCLSLATAIQVFALSG